MVDAYPRRLADLPEEGFLLPPAARRLCLLTGQSRFRSSLLSPEQRDFLAAVAPDGLEVPISGFPWHERFATPAPPPSLFLAALRNGRQWMWARHDAVYLDALTTILGRLLARTRERLFLVTGSCGIDLLAAVLPVLPPGPEIHVVALGPVGRSPRSDALAGQLAVQGRRDGWSRHLWRGPVHARPDCGHLGYHRDASVIAATRAFLKEAAR